MKRCAIGAFVLICISWALCGLEDYRVQLPGAKPSLFIPLVVTNQNGVSFAAYRLFNWAGNSDTLSIVAFDVHTGRQIKRITIPVPNVHGVRVS